MPYSILLVLISIETDLIDYSNRKEIIGIVYTDTLKLGEIDENNTRYW